MKLLSVLAAFLIAAFASVPGHAADKGGPAPGILQTLDNSLSPMELWKGFYVEGGFGITASELDLGAPGGGTLLTLGESAWSGHVGIGYDRMVAPQILVGALARVEFSDLEFGVAGQSLADAKIAYVLGARAGFVPREDALIYGLLGYKWSEFDAAAGLGSVEPQGWVVGGGLEFMLTDHVGLGLEYTTTLFDDETVAGVVALEPTEHTARVRALYKF